MKVLVICAHYNHTRFLPDCVDSLLAQTHHNWQLLIVDDKSTSPDTSEVISNLISLDSRIHAIRLLENAGAYIARNTGISASLSFDPCKDWTHVTFIDPDDVATPGWLEHVLSILGEQEGSVRPFLQRYDIDLKTPLHAYFGHCPTIHSRFAWERAGGFLPVRRSGDSEMTVRLSHLAKDGLTSVLKSWDVAQKCRHIPGSATHQDLRARKVWLEKRNDELTSLPISRMKISDPVTAAWEKFSE
ncbi:MAG: hypothetical protein COA49_02775 [Bacteroidetes bacterium]|nr:MAG: hypothetical protein COA49_02775 [Bacteroidota bacterium]